MEKAGGTARPSHTKSHLPGHSPLAAVLDQRSSLRPHWLKLMQMGTEIVQMKGDLGWFIGLFMPVQDIFVLPWQLQSAQNKKNFFPHRTLFQFICPHRPVSWADSRAGSPVS